MDSYHASQLIGAALMLWLARPRDLLFAIFWLWFAGFALLLVFVQGREPKMIEVATQLGAARYLITLILFRLVWLRFPAR